MPDVFGLDVPDEAMMFLDPFGLSFVAQGVGAMNDALTPRTSGGGGGGKKHPHKNRSGSGSGKGGKSSSASTSTSSDSTAAPSVTDELLSDIGLSDSSGSGSSSSPSPLLLGVAAVALVGLVAYASR